MQSTLKITDPSKNTFRGHVGSYFFFVSLILCFESTACIQGRRVWRRRLGLGVGGYRKQDSTKLETIHLLF